MSALCATLQTPTWGSGPVYFIADIGGTNARLGFGRTLSGSGGVHIIYTTFAMRRKDIAELKDFFAVLLRSVPACVVRRIVSGAVSVPGPVTNGAVGGPFNNLKGIARLAEYPTELFPPGRSTLLNDLEAGGYGVLALSDSNVFDEYFRVMWEGTKWRELETTPAGTTLGKGRCFVVAPGTGIGTSLIDYRGVDKSYSVLPLEFSSTTLAARPGSDDYLQKLASHHALPQYTPSVEKATNGKAMEYHYMSLTGRHKSARDIAQDAKRGDAAATQALAQTMENLMAACSEATMLFLPLTCILIGDNVVYNSFFYDKPEQLAKLRETVQRHPMEQQFGFIGRTTFLRQVKALNLNMLGCYGFGTHLHPQTSVSAKL